MDNIIENTYLTNKYINTASYSGVLCLDAKYVKVKGYETKIPFLYCIDYYSHDIVCGFLCISENREAFKKLFRLLKTVKYPLKFVIMDDVIEKALLPLKYYYPRSRIQLCSTHFLRNTRDLLRIAEKKTKKNYEPFLKDFSRFLRSKVNIKKKEKSLNYFLRTYGIDPFIDALLELVIKKKDYLFLFCRVKKDIPHTNNLIKSFNSHLEGRLKTIKGFRSFHSAERFLNAWMIRRRTKVFVSCSKKFDYLNKKTSLEMCLKDEYFIEKVIKDIYENR